MNKETNKLYKTLLIILFLLPIPTFAGPICSGFWDCLPLTLIVLTVTVLPPALVIFVVLSVIYFAILRKQSRWWKWLLLFVISILIAHLGTSAIQNESSNRNFQSVQTERAKQLSFGFYVPTIVLPGYDLVETSIEGTLVNDGALVYSYYNRDTQDSKDSVAARGYYIVNQAPTEHVRAGYYVHGPLVATKNFSDATVSIFGTVSELEAQQVLTTLEGITKSDIAFYTDWPSNWSNISSMPLSR